MKTSPDLLKKHFLLLKETFLEVTRIRNESYIHHECFEGGDPSKPELCDGDFLFSVQYDGWKDEFFDIGLGWTECLLNKVNWDRKELFKIAANVNLELSNGEERIIDEYSNPIYPRPLDQKKIDELAQQGLQNIEKFEKEL
ncbi:hypothetical protein Q4Q35_10855 [Flavivirga aquimarina]|uniref:Uncharacterized protein n=1 Tax=Flavivirga aquimarina TaxID=2027862 RepID=A0ABT8WB21_9FLAO|nr:hypothetical protein [Flavivirga aquimarina]MDO5970305.1 hypothetical protein [Flavivirga aquimarina]